MSLRYSSCQRKGEIMSVASESVLKDNFFLEVIALPSV